MSDLVEACRSSTFSRRRLIRLPSESANAIVLSAFLLTMMPTGFFPSAIVMFQVVKAGAISSFGFRKVSTKRHNFRPSNELCCSNDILFARVIHFCTSLCVCVMGGRTAKSNRGRTKPPLAFDSPKEAVPFGLK